jgi:hypothetical protein
MAKSFTAQLDEWSRKTDGRLRTLFHESAKGVAETASTPVQQGGHLPYEKGNLQRSLAVSTIGPIKMLWGVKEFHGTRQAVEDVIESAEIGQTVWIGFQAIYARKAEDKHGFVRLAAQQWQVIVVNAAGRAKRIHP